MKTKIKLQYPYNEQYTCGYLNINKEPRRILSLIRKDGTRTSTAYARYLMSCHLKRYLTKDECVDHVDNNKLNDVIENLQILTIKENSIKSVTHLNKTAKDIKLVCPVCNVVFHRPAKNVNFKLKQGKKITCSRRCGGINSHKSK